MGVVEELKRLLLEDRIKHGIDYAITHKYGKTHVMCHHVWKKTIEVIADELGLSIDDWYTYPKD